MEFEFSAKVKDLQTRLTAFMEERIYLNEAKYEEHCQGPDRWQPVPMIEELKPKARAAGLWNLFLPASEHGAGLTSLEYAPLCESWAVHPWVRKYSTARRPTPGTWKFWSATDRLS